MIKTMDSRDNSAASALLRIIPEELSPLRDGKNVRLERNGRSWLLMPIWIGEGLPADAKRAFRELSNQPGQSATGIPVIVAKRVSPGARELIEAERLSWADASGRARIEDSGSLYITRLEPIRADAKRSFRWSQAADAVAEVLLAQHFRRGAERAGTVSRVCDLAELSGVSTAHTARVLRQFDEQHYTAKSGAERGSSASRELKEPGRLLSDWAGNHARAEAVLRPIEYHVLWREVARSEVLLEGLLSGLTWAATGSAAAEKIAPHLTQVNTLDICVPLDEISAVRGQLEKVPEATEVASGGRIRVYPVDQYVLRLADKIDRVPIVSPVRVYADLLRDGGRSAEAAEHLREVAIGF